MVAECEGIKPILDPVFFMSLVGADREGTIDEHQHIFDVYTKLYEFGLSEVKFKSAQDLWEYYESRNKGCDKLNTNIYSLTEYFVRNHPNAHYVLDEVPFIVPCKYKACEHVIPLFSSKIFI